MKLFHGTNVSRAYKILVEGLSPQPIENRIWNFRGKSSARPSHRDTSVYLAGHIQLALMYAKRAARKENCEPAIITVELPSLDRLCVDDDYLRIANPLDYKNWMPCFATTCQVAYEGSISKRYVS
jgi:hypothetical protein